MTCVYLSLFLKTLNNYLTIYYSWVIFRIMETPEETKSRIVKSAENRFSSYSFGKTTMAEIAKDCQMSAANLYRFFESKEDIAVEIGNQCMEHKEKVMRNVMERPGLSAADRLEAIVIENLRYTYDLLSKQPHISEIVESICGGRMDVMQGYKKTTKDIFAGVLEEGNKSGEFKIEDTGRTAELILSATIKYCYPQIIQQEGLTLGELESEARSMIGILTNGLVKR